MKRRIVAFWLSTLISLPLASTSSFAQGLTGDQVRSTFVADAIGTTIDEGTYTVPASYTFQGTFQIDMLSNSILITALRGGTTFLAGTPGQDFEGFRFNYLTGSPNIIGLTQTSSGVQFATGYAPSTYTSNSVNLSLNGAYFSSVGSNINLALNTPAAVGAVPEPATWAMMIVGLGVAGGTMRRRQREQAQVSLAA